jgi:hypothetical protein
MPLLTAGYFHTTFWAKDYWNDNYWLEYGADVAFGWVHLDGITFFAA